MIIWISIAVGFVIWKDSIKDIVFPPLYAVGMDTLLTFGPLTHDKVMDFIEANIPDFRSYIEKDRESIYAQVQYYLKRKQFSAKTFEEYGLGGTPSAILIDKNGVLRQTVFGSNSYLEGAVKQLLND